MAMKVKMSYQLNGVNIAKSKLVKTLGDKVVSDLSVNFENACNSYGALKGFYIDYNTKDGVLRIIFKEFYMPSYSMRRG